MMRMRGIRMGMREIRVGMIGMRGIRMEKWGIGRKYWEWGGIGSGNEGKQGDNLRIGVKMMNKNCGER